MEHFAKFFGFQTPLSNLRFTAIEQGGTTYPSLEHWFQYQKAMFCGDEETAQKILAARTPEGARGLGKKIKGPKVDAWVKEQQFARMREGCYLKFTQNKGPRKYLFKTAGKTLVLCDPNDTTWGIGLSRFEPNSDIKEKWEGPNMLGKILGDVRDDLMGRLEFQKEIEEIKNENKKE